MTVVTVIRGGRLNTVTIDTTVTGRGISPSCLAERKGLLMALLSKVLLRYFCQK